jgi:hypothetical protein
MEIRNAFETLIRKLEGNRPLRRHRHNRWEDNINMGLRKTGFEGVDWIHLA